MIKQYSHAASLLAGWRNCGIPSITLWGLSTFKRIRLTIIIIWLRYTKFNQKLTFAFCINAFMSSRNSYNLWLATWINHRFIYQVSAMQETHLFSKRKIGIHNYAMLCFPPVIYSVCCGWFTFYKYKNVLSICICLYHLVVSCYLCLNTQSTKTLTPTSRVQYSPKP